MSAWPLCSAWDGKDPVRIETSIRRRNSKIGRFWGQSPEYSTSIALMDGKSSCLSHSISTSFELSCYSWGRHTSNRYRIDVKLRKFFDFVGKIQQVWLRSYSLTTSTYHFTLDKLNQQTLNNQVRYRNDVETISKWPNLYRFDIVNTLCFFLGKAGTKSTAWKIAERIKLFYLQMVICLQAEWQ